MNLLVSFASLVLVIWSGQHTGALPKEAKLARLDNGVLAKEHRDVLLKMLSGLSDLSTLEEEEQGLDSEPPQQAELGKWPLVGQPVRRDRYPCKNFFWKTFSSC
ncbi:hypothetical protein SKAU_G00111040 [Synaphobranchus kaupii]|uniref:Somatostatin/Cortistatin C-terminal domain-containing protein n=1 Tax=Synaphobranchus kaupii TaxID=118154 RepID=A0A9Q1G1K3_SYNKA|nr:hypothetical protein SKAU_G00111040 [Synaphobranchus kaupii]